MPTPAEIDKYIAAHGMWKARLRQVITTGKSDAPAATVRRDDQCEFGKWLHAATPIDRRHPHFQTVKQLHQRFHHAAAHVVELAAAGKSAEAERLMAMGGEFAQVSMQLTSAMKEWKLAAAA
jgi:hypothetical protein